MNKRNKTVDILKGLAIITVILVHVFRGKGKIDVLIGEVSRWAVPCFFMIQGLYMSKSAKKSWISNFKNKITKVYLPFILFSTLYGLYFLRVRGKAFTISDIILGKTAIHLYFVNHYMVFAIFAPLLYKLKDNIRNNFLWVMIISNFILCLAYEIQKSYGIKLIFYNGFNPVKYWGFIALGMLVYERENILNYVSKNRNKTIIISTVVTIIGIIIPYITNTVGYMYNKASLFPLAIGMTVLIASYFNGNKVKGKGILSYIGKRSFGIYLIHLFIIHFLKSILGIKPLWIIPVLTLIICLLLLELSKVIINKLVKLFFSFDV